MKKWMDPALAMAGALALTGCGPPPSSGAGVPIDVVIGRVTGGPDVAQLQIILASPSSKFDPLSHPQQCTKTWLPANQALQLTGADGQKHASQVFDLSGGASGSAKITGIPPAKQVLLIVEALSADHELVGLGFKSPIDEITAGDNAAVSVTVTRFDPVDCGDPIY